MSGTNHQAPPDFNGTGAQAVTDHPEYAIVFIDDEQLVVHTHSYMNDYS